MILVFYYDLIVSLITLLRNLMSNKLMLFATRSIILFYNKYPILSEVFR